MEDDCFNSFLYERFGKSKGDKIEYGYKLIESLEENLEMLEEFLQTSFSGGAQKPLMVAYFDAKEKYDILKETIEKILGEDYIDSEGRKFDYD